MPSAGPVDASHRNWQRLCCRFLPRSARVGGVQPNLAEGHRRGGEPVLRIRRRSQLGGSPGVASNTAMHTIPSRRLQSSPDSRMPGLQPESADKLWFASVDCPQGTKALVRASKAAGVKHFLMVSSLVRPHRPTRRCPHHQPAPRVSASIKREALPADAPPPQSPLSSLAGHGQVRVAGFDPQPVLGGPQVEEGGRGRAGRVWDSVHNHQVRAQPSGTNHRAEKTHRK